MTWVQQLKHQWWTKQEAKLREEFAPQLSKLQTDLQQQTEQLQTKWQELQRLQTQVADQEQILTDRQAAVASANEECRTQLRLLEAKAAPDRVWVEAFSRGYQTAWDTIWPLMSQGVQNTKLLIEQKAIEETLARLDTTVVERATALGQVHAREIHELLKKQEEFQRKQQGAASKEDKLRYEHYLTALDWMLHANGLHPHQPVSQ